MSRYSRSIDESPFQGVREGVGYRFVRDCRIWHCYRSAGDGLVHAGIVLAPGSATLDQLIDRYLLISDDDEL